MQKSSFPKKAIMIFGKYWNTKFLTNKEEEVEKSYY